MKNNFSEAAGGRKTELATNEWVWIEITNRKSC